MTMNKRLFLFLLILPIYSFSNFVFYSSNNFKYNFESKFSLNLQISVSTLENKFVTHLNNNSWYAPTNPAENLFYTFNYIKPFLNFEIAYNLQNLIIYTTIPFQKETISKAKDPSTNFLLVDNKPSLDLNGPENFLVGYITDNVFLGIGRFPIHWEDAKYPISISDTTFQDNLTFSAKIYNFKFTCHLISSYPILSQNEQEIQQKYTDQHTPYTKFYEPYKTIAAHRFDFFFGNTRIGIGEINVIGGKFPDLIDINPLMFYHNTYGEGYSNVMASVDFSAKFNEKLKLYGEFCLDDYNTPTEKGSEYKPNAFGYNIGSKFSFGKFNFWIEYDFTSEWMYITNYLPYLRINVRHFYLDNLTSPHRSLMDYPLGFKYGPDATMLSIGFNFNDEDRFDISCEYNLLLKGTVKEKDTNIIRWKWFWDSWPKNVEQKNVDFSFEKSSDLLYNIVAIELTYKNTSFNVLFINKKYFLSLLISL